MKKIIYAAIATALVSYLSKKLMGRKANETENNSSSSLDHHLTNVFSKAKNHAMG